MRYTEPKERSAEILRQVLAHMGRHAAAFNPLTFTVWYEHAAGINPALSAALERRLAQRLPVDDESAADLYREHVAPPDAGAMHDIGSAMQHLMATMARSAAQTGQQAGTFGAQLNGLSAALASANTEQLAPWLTQVLAGTASMKHSAEALQRQAMDSQDEIDRLRGALEKARVETLQDPLTGILNRRGFDEKLKAMVSVSAATEAGHCLVMLDIDHFKQVNDTHGHLVGDRVIQALGEVLRSTVTNPQHSVARYGGEEFAILLPDASADQGARIAEAVRTRTRAMKFRNRATRDLLLSVSVSAGVATLRPGDDATTLIERADAALYRSKANGRDRVTCA